jgi:hypothetical protein
MKRPKKITLDGRRVNQMGAASCAGVGYTSTAAILVLFILLAIIASVYNFGW